MKKVDLLQYAVFVDLEFAFLDIVYRTVIAVYNANVQVNQLSIDLDDLVRIVDLGRRSLWRGRWRGCWRKLGRRRRCRLYLGRNVIGKGQRRESSGGYHSQRNCKKLSFHFWLSRSQRKVGFEVAK